MHSKGGGGGEVWRSSVSTRLPPVLLKCDSTLVCCFFSSCYGVFLMGSMFFLLAQEKNISEFQFVLL